MLKILTWPKDSIALKFISTPVNPEQINTPEFQKLIDDMFETMYEHNGVGVSVVQIGRPIQLFVMDVGVQEVFINSKILEYIGEPQPVEEGCLSFPGIFEKINRSRACVVEYLDRNGVAKVHSRTEIASQVIQHESEHQAGLTLLDSLSITKKRKVLKKMRVIK